MKEEDVKQLVLALIAAGRIPTTSYEKPDQEWAEEVLKEFENYVRLFTEALKRRQASSD